MFAKKSSFVFSLALTFFLATGAQAQLAGQAEAEFAYAKLDTHSPQNKEGLTAQERQTLLTETREHKIAKTSMISHYDPKGDIGFCFGRAMTAHLLGRKMGLAEDSIRKLFVIGDLRSGDAPEWRFHVTTLVKGQEDGQWYAIDPIMRAPISTGTPILAQEWIDVVQRVWDKNKKANFYFVGNDNIVPDMTRFGATLADETGERIIELSFSPVDKTGIAPFTFATTTVYELDRVAQTQHFIRTDETTAEERFNFLKLVMTVHKSGETKLREFDYLGYFLDLLEDLTSEAQVAPPTLRGLSLHLPSSLEARDAAPSTEVLDLGSMRLNF